MSEKAATLCIVIAAKGAVSLTPCLQALRSSSSVGRIPIAIHIAHDGIDLVAPDGGQIPIDILPCPEGTSILRLWGIALARAQTDYVAVLDASCPPDICWLDAVVQSIEQGLPAFYGPVEPGWPLHDRRIVGYLTEYAQFKSPITCDDEFPGNNLVVRTDLLDSAESLSQNGFYKTFMLWRLKSEHGISPSFIEQMQVVYRKPFDSAPYMKRRRMHGRCFAASRLEQPDQPPRWACIGFTPVLFLLRTWRIFLHLAGKPAVKRSFFRFLPLILISELAWSYGELEGYTVGAGGACDHLD